MAALGGVRWRPLAQWCAEGLFVFCGRLFEAFSGALQGAAGSCRGVGLSKRAMPAGLARGVFACAAGERVSAMRTLYQDAHLMGREGSFDLLVSDGKFEAVAPHIEAEAGSSLKRVSTGTFVAFAIA